MGFSVSGSFAILVLATFIAFGTLYPAGANGFERVTDAMTATYDDDLARQNTAIDIARLNFTDGTLEVNVTNEGTTALSVEATDLIVNGTYHTHDEFDELRVDGDPGTGVWLPGEELFIRIQPGDAGSSPRTKVVTEHGVADAAEVDR